MRMIYNLGSVNIDYVYSVDRFVSAGETLSSKKMETFAGGKGLNQSLALSRAGAKVTHGAIIGKGGKFLIDLLQESGVLTDRIKQSTETDGHAIIQVDSSGQNCIMLYPGTNAEVTREYIDFFLQDAKCGDILVLQNETSGIPYAFSAAKAKNMKLAFNPSPFDQSIKNLPLETVTWLFCNEIEGRALFGGETAKQISENFRIKYPNGNLILTLGSNGSYFINREKTVFEAAHKVNAVDTTAAGDTFTGYFLSAISCGKSEEYALALATAAAKAVTVKGAAPSIPTVDEL